MKSSTICCPSAHLYFVFVRLLLKCPESYNIAEFLIKKISVSEHSDRERIRILCDIYSTSKQATIVKEKIEAICFEQYLSSEGMSFLVDNRKVRNRQHVVVVVDLKEYHYYLLYCYNFIISGCIATISETAMHRLQGNVSGKFLSGFSRKKMC